MTTITPPTLVVLRLSMLRGVGPATLRKITSGLNVLSATVEEMAASSRPVQKAISEQGSWAAAEALADQQVEIAERNDARILSFLDPEYPKLLIESKNDPAILFVKGTLHSGKDHSVAIVGTREPTDHGKLITDRISEFFIENGWSIVSGLALGCDSVAHRTAIRVKGHTIAVLAHGLQTVAPRQNEQLANEILDVGGALVSQFPFGRKVIPANFVVRDKTQAGLSQGVVMVQSSVAGGSLHAARASLEYDRWLAVPFPTDRDRNENSDKVAANMLIASDSSEQIGKLLKCERSTLERVHILRSRHDYDSLLSIGDSGGLS